MPGQTPTTGVAGREDHSASLAQPIVRNLAPSGGEPVSILGSFGVPVQKATALALVADIARRAGLIVCVRGVAARPAVEAWVRALAQRGMLIDATVGLIDDSVMRSVLATTPPPDLVALLDANLSALDIYARSLADLVLARLAKGSSEHPLTIFLSLADGVGALPLPRTFERVCVLIDLDERYIFRSASDADELMAEAVNLEDGTLYAHLWRPAADRLRAQIDELEPEQRTLVLSVLVVR